MAVYARTRLKARPEVDLLDRSVRHAWERRDTVLQPIETPAHDPEASDESYDIASYLAIAMTQGNL